MDLIIKRNETEKIALAFGCKAHHQGSCNIAFENGCGVQSFFLIPALKEIGIKRYGTCAETGGIDNNIDLLGSFNLKNLGNRLASPGSCLTVNVFKTVTGKILSELFKLASLAHLPLGMNSQSAV